MTLIGNLIWCAALAAIGWALGKSWSRFNHDFSYLEYAIVLALVAGATLLLVRWRRTARHELPFAAERCSRRSESFETTERESRRGEHSLMGRLLAGLR